MMALSSLPSCACLSRLWKGAKRPKGLALTSKHLKMTQEGKKYRTFTLNEYTVAQPI